MPVLKLVVELLSHQFFQYSQAQVFLTYMLVFAIVNGIVMMFRFHGDCNNTPFHFQDIELVAYGSKGDSQTSFLPKLLG